MAFFSWLNRKLGLGVNENQAMLSQFLLNLDVSYARFSNREPGGDVPENEQIIAEVLDRFKNGAGTGHNERNVKWKDAYQAEQMLATLMPLADVRIELIKYLSETNILSPGAKASYDTEFQKIFPEAQPQVQTQAQAQTQPDAPGRAAAPALSAEDALRRARSLLVRVLNDVQWRYARRYYLRKLTQYYLRKIMWTFFASGAAFTCLLIFFEAAQTHTEGFYGFFFALTAGLLGASLSMLTGRQEISAIDTLEAMKSATGYGVVLVRIGVGGGAAAILYFLFETGIVSSSLFPNLDMIGFVEVKGACGVATTACEAAAFRTPNADLCKLAFWGFTAGFSEKLVPRILTSTSDKLTETEPTN